MLRGVISERSDQRSRTPAHPVGRMVCQASDGESDKGRLQEPQHRGDDVAETEYDSKGAGGEHVRVKSAATHEILSAFRSARTKSGAMPVSSMDVLRLTLVSTLTRRH